MEKEAAGEAAAELSGGGGGVEDQFAQLESGSDVDDELAAMKAQLSGSSQNQQALPESEQPTNTQGQQSQSQGQQSQSQGEEAVSDGEMDAELEALRKQLDG
jgi:phage shock protein A